MFTSEPVETLARRGWEPWEPIGIDQLVRTVETKERKERLTSNQRLRMKEIIPIILWSLILYWTVGHVGPIHGDNQPPHIRYQELR